MSTRRQFIQIIPVAGLGALSSGGAQAAMVDEGEAQAKALGYVSDATRANRSKYKQYAAGQLCSNCALYQGKTSDPAAGCALFPGKQVAGAGWCSAYAKKA